jgi:cytochrome b561
VQPVSTSQAQYDRATIWFHWSTAILVIAQWIGAKTVDIWPKGALKVDAISMHMTGGAMLGLLVLVQIWWRATRGRRLPGIDGGYLKMLAKAMHWGLYLAILVVVALGLTMVSVRSVSYFNLFMLPTLGTASRPLLRSIRGYHELIATAILVAAGLHAAMALVHQYVWRDGVLSRMIPQTTAR